MKTKQITILNSLKLPNAQAYTLQRLLEGYTLTIEEGWRSTTKCGVLRKKGEITEYMHHKTIKVLIRDGFIKEKANKYVIIPLVSQFI